MEAELVLPMVKDMLEQSQRIEIPYEAISQACIEMREDSRICGEETRMYLPSLYFSEVGIASKILELKEKNKLAENFSRDEIRKAIGDIEEQLGVSYAPTQIQAIETALNSAVMILRWAIDRTYRNNCLRNRRIQVCWVRFSISSVALVDSILLVR